MSDLLRILSEWNRWWETGSVSPELTGKKRRYTHELSSLMDAREVKVLTGVRRSGKSTLFYQLIEGLLKDKGIPGNQIMLVNFEDEALMHFTLEEIYNAYQTHLSPKGKVFLFLDEVQQKVGWERWIRKKYDLKEAINFLVTGSSASLLSREYATLLTGRNLTTTIYPLSFLEVLHFSGIQINDIYLVSQEMRNRINGVLIEYLQEGGFPEVVFQKQNLKRRLLNQYFQDIVYKDIVGRHGCHPTRIKDLASYLMTNVANPTSLRALRGAFGYGLNVIGDYLGYLEDAFLIFQVYLFDYSMKKQLVNPRKIYTVDNGIRNAVAFNFSRDEGRLLENAVFMELRRRERDIYYWKDKRGREIDFLIRKELKIESAIQVCSDPNDEKTVRREMSALDSAMKEYDLKEGLIITMNDAGTLKREIGTITLVPLYEWLLG
ncbi:MAG: ATP-binding protein [Thermodesulfobacteriota bacterium]|nr:ATP-binding protein [Thermodesulfobacteriota bacterium]